MRPLNLRLCLGEPFGEGRESVLSVARVGAGDVGVMRLRCVIYPHRKSIVLCQGGDTPIDTIVTDVTGSRNLDLHY